VEPRFRVVFLSEDFDAFGIDVQADTRKNAILLASVLWVEQGRTEAQKTARRRALRSQELVVEVHDRSKPKWARQPRKPFDD
jgi:hypothetical protein